MENRVSLIALQKEILDMLNVCFEGTAMETDNAIELTLKNGQCIRMVIGEKG